jgi:hypothetical protein
VVLGAIIAAYAGDKGAADFIDGRARTASAQELARSAGGGRRMAGRRREVSRSVRSIRQATVTAWETAVMERCLLCSACEGGGETRT